MRTGLISPGPSLTINEIKRNGTSCTRSEDVQQLLTSIPIETDPEGTRIS
jgi:hypothetical protein